MYLFALVYFLRQHLVIYLAIHLPSAGYALPPPLAYFSVPTASSSHLSGFAVPRELVGMGKQRTLLDISWSLSPYKDGAASSEWARSTGWNDRATGLAVNSSGFVVVGSQCMKDKGSQVWWNTPIITQEAEADKSL